jgi:prepilin-type N-terminal cleavage/methylation domain-containing protein
MATLKTGICSKINKKGFTLLELIVVIFIISLILAVSLPSFMLQEEGDLKSEAGRIASILRYLNDSAVSTKEMYSIHVKFKEKSIRYKIPEGDREEKIHYLSRVLLQSKGNVSEGEVTIFFLPTGTGENFTVFLTGTESTMEIIYNALSGRVKVLSREGT